MELTSAQRRFLKAQAHHLQPVVRVGKQGVSEALCSEVDTSLGSHELIKVRFVEGKEEKRELAAELSERVSAALVGLIGNHAILYRRHADPDKREITLP